MNLDRVTITGADDSIHPADLVALSEEFPFVEWGILASQSAKGSARFPSFGWIIDLQNVADAQPLNLSLHLCGAWVRELLMGNIAFQTPILGQFQRVQLNFHAERTKCNPMAMHGALASIPSLAGRNRQFIFQIDGNGGNEHLHSLYQLGAEPDIDTAPLFDISGGAGVLPAEWPEPYFMQDGESHSYHGYAGGLGPDNLAEQIPLIAKAAGKTRIWIDMETRVRSDDDKTFDLAKVRRCLEIAAPFVKQTVTA